MLHTLLYAVFRYLVKGDAVFLVKVKVEQCCKMPAYRLALSIGVGGEIDTFAFFSLFAKLLNKIFLALYDGVFRGEIVLYIHRQARRGKVAHMAHRSYDIIPLSEIALYIFRLCGRLDYNKL